MVFQTVRSQGIALCGTPDRDSAEYAAILEQVTSSQNSSSGTTQWEIPIWLYVVRDDAGNFPHQQNFTPGQLIEEANAHFLNTQSVDILHFYVCGVTYIDESDWTALHLYQNEWSALSAYANSINPEYDNGFVSVFLVTAIHDKPNHITQGYAGFPTQITRSGVLIANLFADNLAHELGHYFGLIHTHTGGPNDQYVGSAYCSTTGDKLCDTPADPGGPTQGDYCSSSDCISTTCTIQDPLNQTYAPDPTMTMSYYEGCRNKFSDEQYAIMIYQFLQSADFAFLRDTEEPTCQDLPNDRGYVIRKCDDSPIAKDAIKFLNPSNQICGVSGLITDLDGRYTTYSCLLPSYTGDLAILPDKNYQKKVLNGVDAGDITIINKHILGLAPFKDPFQLIASDVNNSGSVTTFDLLLIKKVLLGKEGSFSAGSWRYIPDLCFEDQAFATEFSDDDDSNKPGVQLNPFNASWTDPQSNFRQYNGSAMPNNDSWMDHLILEPYESYANNPEAWSFKGVKVGDVNCGADVEDSQANSSIEETFLVESHTQITANDTFYLVIWADSSIGNTPVVAWQLGIEVDPAAIDIIDVQSSDFDGFNSDFYHYISAEGQGKLRALWYDSLGLEPTVLNKNLLLIQAKALQTISDVGQYFQLRDTLLSKYLYDNQNSALEEIPLHLGVTYNPVSPRAAQNNFGEGLSSVSVYPVPFKSELLFQFYAHEAGDVRITLFNPFGSIISTSKIPCIKGDNTARLQDLEAFPNGLYYYSLNSDVFITGGHLLKM